MAILTEPIGSIPRPAWLIEAVAAAGDGTAPALDAMYEKALKDTVEQFEATGSPVITDGDATGHQRCQCESAFIRHLPGELALFRYSR